MDNVAAVINLAAGSSGLFDVETLDAQIKAALGPNAKVEIRPAQPGEVESALKWAFESGASSVLIVGGDGTARSAASLAMETKIPMIPLPGGTMNVLPKLVFGHADLKRAIEELPTLKLAHMDVGRAANEPFFLTFAVGVAGSLAKFRESMRPPRDWNEVASSALGAAGAMGAAYRGRIDWSADGRKMRPAQSLVVAVGGFSRVLSPETPNDDNDHQLQAAALRLRSHWDMVRFGAHALTGNWRQAKNVQLIETQVIDLALGSRRPLVVLDGEPMRLAKVDQLRLDRGALPVMALPQAPAAA
ncbi:MAG: diacylglycerol kinase family protein [Caulobacterales bacterium]